MNTKQEKEKVYISDDTIQMVIRLLFERGYDKDYVEQLKARMNDRIKFVQDRDTVKGGFDKLPEEALDALKKVTNALN